MKNIIVREYLESLTEREELDYIFPILLEAMNFTVVSTPAMTRGLSQYGKDVVAVKKDEDGIKKRYYFELKGGSDKNITSDSYNKTDGVRESIYEAKDRAFKDSSIPGFNDMPVKIIVAHNGVMHPSVKETFDGMIEREFPQPKPGEVAPYSFERWDIFRLTDLFTEWLFNEYLLVDATSTTLFKRVLVLMNTPGNDFGDFYRLIDFIVQKAGKSDEMGARKKLLFFETVRMVSFIVYRYAADENNLEPAKKCIPNAILRLWHWIIGNGLEADRKIIEHFSKVLSLYAQVLEDYFAKTLPIAVLQHGLLSESGGRYEQIGYPIRSMEYLSYLLFYFQLQDHFNIDQPERPGQQTSTLVQLLNANDGISRPFFDNHSIAIALTLNFLIRNGHKEPAIRYLRNVVDSIMLGYRTHGRLPDGNNSMDSVIRLAVTRKKSVYYQDSTSHLFGMILEYIAILNLEEDYHTFRAFIETAKVDTAIFVPYNDEQLAIYLPDIEPNHELQFLNHQLFKEGYQANIKMPAAFLEFQKITAEKPAFAYNYRTIAAGFSCLMTLAHVHYKTPFFPDDWRLLRI